MMMIKTLKGLIIKEDQNFFRSLYEGLENKYPVSRNRSGWQIVFPHCIGRLEQGQNCFYLKCLVKNSDFLKRTVLILDELLRTLGFSKNIKMVWE
jgi:hypothetical protein